MIKSSWFFSLFEVFAMKGLLWWFFVNILIVSQSHQVSVLKKSKKEVYMSVVEKHLVINKRR
jgi:hypothetical protein